MNELMRNKKSFTALLFMIFAAGGMYGFVYELLFYYLNDGMWLKRGEGFGPWIQIYAFGGILVFFVCYRFRKNALLVMLSSGIACGLLELIAGYILYGVFNLHRMWDYNVEKWNWGNIGGYVCLRSIAVFAVSGLILIYVLLPILQWFEQKFGTSVFFTVALIIFIIIAVDLIYNNALTKIFHLTNAKTFYDGLGWPHK